MTVHGLPAPCDQQTTQRHPMPGVELANDVNAASLRFTLASLQ
jgi:hypothetical protein